MRTTRVNFENEAGEQLSGRLEWPVGGSPQAFAVFAHCFTCTKNLKAVGNVSRALTADGIAVLRFDMTGLGESEGDFAGTNFSSNVGDLIEAARFLERGYQAPSLLVGHSLGGAAVLLAGGQLDSVRAVATIGAPADPAHVKAHFESRIEEIEGAGEARVNIGGRPFRIRKQFVDDLDAQNMEKHIGDLRKPLLVMHSPQDVVVGVENARKIYEQAHHPKSYISLDGADHLLSRKEDSLYVGNMIAGWVRRYIDISNRENLATDKQVAVRTTNESYTTEVVAGKHRLLADEPESAGGDDLGPDPYGYLLSGLGACTAMTLHMYAKRKGWPLTEVRVHLEHDHVHAEDCDACESSSGKLDKFSRLIEMEGDLTEEQRERLIEIANKCPVHKTLHSEVLIETTELRKER